MAILESPFKYLSSIEHQVVVTACGTTASYYQAILASPA